MRANSRRDMIGGVVAGLGIGLATIAAGHVFFFSYWGNRPDLIEFWGWNIPAGLAMAAVGFFIVRRNGF